MSDETPGGRYLCKTGQHVLASMTLVPAGLNKHTLAMMEEIAVAEFSKWARGNSAEPFEWPHPPVPDSPSETAVTEEMLFAANMKHEGYCDDDLVRDIYRAMRALEPNDHRKLLAWDKHADTIRRDRDAALEERDAESARAEASEKELSEETRLRVFWRDRCFASEKDTDFWRAFFADAEDRAHTCLTETIMLRRQTEANQAQIVRLMAERDEARNLLNMATDKLTKFLAAEPKPKTEHNPFRVIEKDRRMMGP